jgi:stearoyl-CoA desaturase (delta-9 desaturase)
VVYTSKRVNFGEGIMLDRAIDALREDALREPACTYGVQQWPPPKVAIALHLLRHIGFVAAIFFIPLNVPLCVLLACSYVVRMWGVEAVSHRYFSHRAFSTSRAFQFVLGLIAAQAAARGPIWWAYVHRRHHARPDTADDLHSPVTHPFIYAYFLWLTVPENRKTELDAVPDLSKYPELRWLNKHNDDIAFGVGAALLVFAGYAGWLGPQIDGWSALLWGVCAPAVMVLHSVGTLTTLCHLKRLPGGYRRYATRDESINRPLVAIYTLGAGYHNNHHRCPGHAKAGFAWYEFDFSYYVLRLLQWAGLIWNVRSEVPEKILKEGGVIKSSDVNSEVHDSTH